MVLLGVCLSVTFSMQTFRTRWEKAKNLHVIADIKVTNDAPGHVTNVHNILHKHGGRFLSRCGNSKDPRKESRWTADGHGLWIFASAESCKTFLRPIPSMLHTRPRGRQEAKVDYNCSTTLISPEPFPIFANHERRPEGLKVLSTIADWLASLGMSEYAERFMKTALISLSFETSRIRTRRSWGSSSAIAARCCARSANFNESLP